MAIAVYLGGRTLLHNGFEIITAVVTLLCGMLGVEFLMIGLNHWPGQLP
jgi:hypothetical protein